MKTIAEYEAALNLESKAREQMAEAYATTQAELIALKAKTVSGMAVRDPDTPGSWPLVYSTHSGIRCLERALHERFEDGRALGRAESNDLIEALQASMRLAG